MDRVRTCSKCGQTKPIEQFTKHAACKDGYQRICKECKNAYLRVYLASNADQRRKRQERKWRWRSDPENRAYENAQQYTRFRDDPERRAHASRKHLIKKKYGITLDEYEQLAAAQTNQCAICGGPPTIGQHRYFHIDHDHKTNEIRGLLCTRCNTALGLFKDNEANLKAAIRYLARSQK